jgi:predicted hydrocarbon binding protein
MKGVVFVKLNEFIVERWGEVFWDELLTAANLPSAGIFTSSLHYDDQELFTLFGVIIEKKNIAGKELQMIFGKWFFKVILPYAPPSTSAHNFKDVFQFLHGAQNMIHIEVNKLDPRVMLPQFIFIDESPSTLTFHYKSPRQLCFFCEGIIHGLAEHTGQTIKVSQPECQHEGDKRCLIQVEKI